MCARATGLSTTCSGTTPPAMRISSITTWASTGCARWRTGTVALEEDGKLGICRQAREFDDCSGTYIWSGKNNYCIAVCISPFLLTRFRWRKSPNPKNLLFLQKAWLKNRQIYRQNCIRTAMRQIFAHKDIILPKKTELSHAFSTAKPFPRCIVPFEFWTKEKPS